LSLLLTEPVVWYKRTCWLTNEVACINRQSDEGIKTHYYSVKSTVKWNASGQVSPYVTIFWEWLELLY